MSLKLYPVPVPSASEAKQAIARHYGRERESWEFLADDIQTPITFAVTHVVETLYPVILAMAKAATGKETTLASGWTYRRADLGTAKAADLTFTAPGDRSEGFVFRVYGDADTVAESEGLVKVSAHAFTDRRYWRPSRKKDVFSAIRNGGSRQASLQYTSQVWSERAGFPMMADGPEKPDPEGTLTVLPPLVEALSAFDPALFRDCVAARGSRTYSTLFEETQDIMTAARGAMAVDGGLPGRAFANLIEIVWRTGMATDAAARLGDIDGVARMLVEENNVSKRTENDFGDDRCGAYVKADGDATTVFFRHEKAAMAVTRTPDRLTISDADYKTGKILGTWVDMSLDGETATESHEAAPFSSHVSSLLRYWMRYTEGYADDMSEEPQVTSAPAP